MYVSARFTRLVSAMIAAVVLMGAPQPSEAQRRPLTVDALTEIPHEPTSPRYRFDPVRQEMVPYEVEGGSLLFRPRPISWSRGTVLTARGTRCCGSPGSNSRR